MTSKAKSVIGIDLGGTNCRGAVVSQGGLLRGGKRIQTPRGSSPSAFFDVLEAFCLDFAATEKVSIDDFAAIGIGIPGVVDRQGCLKSSPNLPELEGVFVGRELSKALGVPVTVLNDANAIALGEALYGAGTAFRSFAALTLGTGVGGAFIFEGCLYEGCDGAAGEIGHVMVEPEGRPCGCGSHGCLEQYASASGIVKNWIYFTEQASSRSFESNYRSMTCKDIIERARQADPSALKAVGEAGRRLGQVLAGIANMLNLDGAVIAGGASEGLDLMMPSIESEMKHRAFDVPADRMKIVRGSLGDDAGILGAAERALKEVESVMSDE